MARTITFKTKKGEFSATPSKIDRKKLYGWTEVVALDDEGQECKLMSIDETGSVKIPLRGTALGILSEKRTWVDRGELKPVKPDGSDATLVKSSYEVPVILKKTVTAEEFLDHSITSVYLLENITSELVKYLKNKIYCFDYSYLDSYDATDAFLIESDDKVFMLIGVKRCFEMIGIEQQYIVDSEEAEAVDDLDFSMF